MPSTTTAAPGGASSASTTTTARHRQRPRSRSSSSSASASSTVDTAAEALLSTTKDAAKSAERALARLVHWDELEDWRQDNHFIHTGYRTTSNSFARSARSLLYLHNESVNIWTHLLGAVFFTLAGLSLWSLIHPRYASASSADVLAFACFFAGAFTCLGMSATYHAISNHSPHVARVGNKLDYTGIVFLIVGSYVPALWYGFFCWPKLLTVYLSTIVLLGLGCLTVSWFDHFRTPAWRPYRAMMFVGLGASGVVPVLHGLSIYGYATLNERMGLNWVLAQGGLYIFGAFLYAARWPERQFPGAFDIWGSSHQLFHILILFAAASHLYGMTKAFDFHHNVMGAQC